MSVHLVIANKITHRTDCVRLTRPCWKGSVYIVMVHFASRWLGHGARRCVTPLPRRGCKVGFF